VNASSILEAICETNGRLKKQICEFGLSAEVADNIIGHHTLVHYNKGAMVALQGAPADVLFCVINGLVKVYCARTNGTRILVKLAGPGDLVGYADYIDSSGYRAQVFEVEALTRTSVALFTREHISKILATLAPSVLLQVIERLNTAWSSMAQWFGTFLAMSFKERLELVLRELAVKFGVRDSRGILLTPELAHGDFADMIGSSRPMVTRLIAEMTDRGFLLRQGKRLVLCDPLDCTTPNMSEKDGVVASPEPSIGLRGPVSASRRATEGSAATRKPLINNATLTARSLSLSASNGRRITH